MCKAESEFLSPQSDLPRSLRRIATSSAGSRSLSNERPRVRSQATSIASPFETYAAIEGDLAAKVLKVIGLASALINPVQIVFIFGQLQHHRPVAAKVAAKVAA